MHANSGRLAVDGFLRVAGLQGRVMAIGDCAVQPTAPLPPTANVAEQQAAYLAAAFNKYYGSFASAEGSLPAPGMITPAAMPLPFLEFLNIFFKASPEFRYIERGMMVSMGFGRGKCMPVAPYSIAQRSVV